MRATIHPGELAGYTVILESIANPDCEPRVAVHVFAGDKTGDAVIGQRAIEKMQDKWQRHHMKKTRWRVIKVHRA